MTTQKRTINQRLQRLKKTILNYHSHINFIKSKHLYFGCKELQLNVHAHNAGECDCRSAIGHNGCNSIGPNTFSYN